MAGEGLANSLALIIPSPVDSGIDIEPIKQKLEGAYARLSSLPPGEDSTATLEEIERLERELLNRYTAYVEKRDSTLPPKQST